MRKIKELLSKSVDFIYRNQDKIYWGIENLENIKGVVDGIMQILS